MVAAAGVRHHNAAVVFLFHLFVFNAQRAHQLDAAHFKPDEKVRVIHDSHLVGFRIAHAHFCVVIFEHATLSVYSGLPCQTGLRFSRNEARPSLKSGVQRMRAFSRMARSRSWSTPGAAEEVMRRFARDKLPGLAAINASESALERAIRLSAGMISLTNPNSFASAASRILPVSNRSRAFFSPICRVRNTETIAGRNPIFTSVYPNFASGTARVKSHSVAIPHPPASAAPFTAAISGRGKLQTRRNIFAMRRESSWFSAGDCWAIAASISKSIPEQNAFPEPVRIPTRAWLFSISSNAVCISAIIAADMALRLSGRFNVIVAICPDMSSSSVEYIFRTLLSIHEWSMSVFCANLVGHFQRLRKCLRFDAGIGARFAKRCKHVFRGDIPDEIISGKGAAAKPRKRAVKASATCLIRREDFFFRILGPAMQMHAKFDSSDVVLYLAVQITHQFGRSSPYSIRQGNRADARVLEPLQGVGNNFGAPGLVIRVSEGHGNIDNQPPIRLRGLLFQFLH